ncbi:hypothetical protein AB6G46_04290 [Providencia hangzhouensis]|uniref:hypothetical protein n=1 Tax=Providencia TaxID=586 RepID=UPI001EF5BF5D|nr:MULTISPECIES: hypothetical protein [Providencia]MCW4539376.1 hypothetical protein [Providencia rettgeri]MDX4117344.1 hypothetical protein [Providencia rettgeri]
MRKFFGSTLKAQKMGGKLENIIAEKTLNLADSAKEIASRQLIHNYTVNSL